MGTPTKQIKAIDLVKGLFEHIHGNLGLLKFSIEELRPNNGHGMDSDKWLIICSFYKTLSSQQPTVYEANIDLTENTVSIKAIKGEIVEETPKTYKFVEEEKKEKEDVAPDK
jgi:hypothetical protein